MTSEFQLIARHFSRPAPGAVLGVGDDAALLAPTAGMELAVACDMLLSGRHFLPDAEPGALGHKALAVNLSDLAAMGASPRWALLALALPRADDEWVEAFAEGFYALAREHGTDLVGGDTTRGPLAVSVTVIGETPPGAALRRDGARPGDRVWVSGRLGDAALALAHLQQRIRLSPHDAAACLPALHRPVPRLALGLALRGIASAAIDVSDGLLADLGHVLERSRVGARIEFDALPRSDALAGQLHHEAARAALLAGGDDYELCFTAPASSTDAVQAAAQRAGTPVTPVGTILAGGTLEVVGADGRPLDVQVRGFDHFA